MTLTHEQLMGKAWKFIEDLSITDDRAKYDADPDNAYLVENIYRVRDAYYDDLESGHDFEANRETLEDFFERHGIKWE
jgi:hypothetical protein